MRYTKSLLAIASILALASTSAVAADAVIENAPVPVASDYDQTFNWSGAYIVGLAGYGSSNTDYTHKNVNNFGGPGGTYKNDGDGFIGGIAAGYNFAFDNGFVVGVEGSIRSGTKQDDGGKWEIYHNSTKTDTKFVGTVTGRVGYAFDNWLIYGKAGWAGASIEASQSYHPAGVAATTWSDKKFANGYVVGAGVDVALTKNIFAGVEYNYSNFGSVSFSGNDSTGKLTKISGKMDDHSVNFRIGFKF
jgi:outer membrane immunogenic protein